MKMRVCRCTDAVKLTNCVRSPSSQIRATEPAVRECAETRAFGEVFIHTSRSDREVLVHHRDFGMPKPPRVLNSLA